MIDMIAMTGTTTLYWLGGIVSFALLVYLTIALLYPEKFS